MSRMNRSKLAISALAAGAVLVAALTVTAPAQAAAQSAAQAPARSAGQPGSGHGPELSWQLLDTGSESHFRGLAPVSREVAWVSGYDGLVLRTTDGGRSWRDVSPAGAGALQFRDISAFDARHAVAMAAGVGADSRLYATGDGGRTWRLAYQNTSDQAFFDCMSFFDRKRGLVMSDPVDGKFRILATRDGGNSWRVQETTGTEAQAGEFGFAASGQCLTTEGRDAWFGAGGVSAARVFHSRDGGRTWRAEASTLAGGESAGVFGLAFRHRKGIAVGGDFAVPAGSERVSATKTGNRPWRQSAQEPSGYRSGVTFVPHTGSTALAVGLTGSDVSYDAGRTWRTFDTGQFDTVACAGDGSCWASGDLGRVARLRR